MYKSSDNGLSWQIINDGIKNSFVSSMSKSPNGLIWAGTWGHGLYFSNDNGSNWQYTDFVNKKVSSIICSGDNDIFVATSNGFYLSENAGQSWMEKDSGLSNIRIEAMIMIDSCIYIGTFGSGVYKSCDKGNTWLNISFNLPSQTIRALTKFSNYILCGTSQGIYRSSELSTDWEEIFQVTSPQTLFVDINEQIFVGTVYDGAFISKDSGITWNNLVNNGLYASDVRSFGTDLAGNIYAGTYGAGIYVSHDSGNNWINLNEGLTHKTVNSFVTNSDGFIFAGTIGGGVYKSIEAITSVSTDNIFSIDTYSLSQNYPNPFNPETSIKYSLPLDGNVKIEVFDILGKHIKTLVDDYKQSGVYEIKFNGASLSSGIYFYSLSAGGLSLTKKFVVIK
jgi:ligand-binding sensor domain-containing protein